MSMVPPAWYADPADPQRIRYWNGTAWTNDVAPLLPAPMPTVPLQPAPFPPAPLQPAPQQHASRPDPYANPEVGDFSIGQHVYDGVPAYFSTPEFAQGAAKVGRVVGAGRAISGILFGLLFAGIALVFLAFGSSATAAPAEYSTVTARVVSLEMDGEYCRPVAQFTDNGELHNATSNVRSSPCSWRVGDSVSVSYDPANIESTASITGGIAIVFTIVPLAFCAVGLIVVGASVRRLVQAVRNR